MTGTLISLESVSKRFNKKDPLALDCIQGQIRPGRITGLVGPDGAGKTTLLRLIAGLLIPTEGRIQVCGFDTSTETENIHDIIGYMPQKFGLYEELTVLENLELYARLKGLTGAEKEATFERMLTFTDLKRFTARPAGKLSGGMKQKLGLACALLSKPRVLLLDEPSVGVDPISRRELWKMVREMADGGMAIIWATAYLDEAGQCEEVLLLNEGKLLFDGAPQDLTARIQGRVYLAHVQPEQRRSLLTKILKEENVVDGSIQGQNLRILYKEKTKPKKGLEYKLTSPRFEDAFIDILKGNYSRESVLAETLQPKSIEKNVPIEAQGLTKRFGDFTAAQDITFKVKRGEVFGLLGPNGAGKSTTFKMLCGLLTPTEGKALVSGFDLKKASSSARSRIGYMAQKFSLYSDLNVIQNLNFFAGIYGLTGVEQQKKIKQLVEIFDLENYRSTAAGTLPLGFKQRLALACAVIHQPDVLFLDEPTSGVDPLTRREFWVHINGMAEKGMTIMVTTHFMDEAEYCDRIALIYRGKNIATGTPEDLKEAIRSKAMPDPTFEEAYIELIKKAEEKENVA